MSELQDAVTLAADLTGVVITLDAKGRCCGRKPVVYRRTGHLFCPRCCAQFSLGGQQQANWAWVAAGEGFAAVRMKADANSAARMKQESLQHCTQKTA